MRLQKILGVLIVGASIVSLGVGCTQEQNVQAETETSTGTALSSTLAREAQERQADVPYVPTPQEVVNQMLELANVSSNDVVYDLGSGDGRIPITAVQKYNATRAVGIEINPRLVEQAQANVQQAGVGNRVQILQQDLFQANLSDASVVTLYLLPNVNLRLRPRLLQELKPGTRIVSHSFDMGEWKPDRVVQVQNANRQHTLYYWVVPENPPANLQ